MTIAPQNDEQASGGRDNRPSQEIDHEQLPAWLDMHQALAWVRFRDVAVAIKANPDTLMAENLWPTMVRHDGRREFQAALKDGRLSAEGARPNEEWVPIPSPQWQRLEVAPRDPSRTAPYEFIRVARSSLLSAFPPLPARRASYIENVAWCSKWIAEGKGTGMDKAWPAFTREPEHKGISRENFRLAWNEAKGRKPRS